MNKIHAMRSLVVGSVSILASAHAALAEQAVEAVSFPGSPLGVARARFTIPDPRPVLPGKERFNVVGEHRRVLYPVFLPDPVPTGPGGPASSATGFEVLFLFPGTEPVTLIASTNLSASAYREFRATTRAAEGTALNGNPSGAGGGARQRELLRWWRAYREILSAAAGSEGHYPVIESYLLSSLPRRLGLPREKEGPHPPRPLGAFPEVERLVDLFVGTESIRIAMQRDALLQVEGEDLEAPGVPLPPAPAIPGVEIPPAPPDTAVEAIARFAPAECLYIRFPRFADWKALSGRAERWGGNLHDLIAGRSFDSRAREALLDQLALRETVLSRLFGDLVVGEMAILAHDTFVREGSALGVLFEVRNEPLFASAMRRLREEALTLSRKWPEGAAVEEEVRLGGHAVSLLRSPGNRIRSFHASLRGYHLVTNCRRLAERFLECGGGGEGSLAEDPGFRHARALHPLRMPQSALVFISDPFLRALVGPAYRAEMTRRTRARAALELAEIARRVAHLETGRSLGVGELARAGYLPQGIVRRKDGSRIEDTPAGAADSLRGYRGSFLPIPDVGVERLTPEEARAYEEFASFYRRQWERVDPAVVRIRLPAGETGGSQPGSAPGEERIDLTIDILPFAREPYANLRWVLGAPGRRALAPLPGDILSIEAEVGRVLAPAPFWARAGILDFERPLVLEGSPGPFLADPGRLPLYLILPVTERLPDGGLKVLFLTATPEQDGLHRIEGGLLGRPAWARERDGRLFISPRKEVARLAAGSPLAFEEGPPAQARLRLLLDPGRRVLPALRREAFERSRSAALSGAGFLSTLHGILKVPLEDCESEARRILAADVVAPGGGRFTGSAYPVAGGPYFSSEAAGGEPAAPEDFPHPVLDGLRDLSVSLTLSGRNLHSEVSLTVQKGGE